MVRVIILTIVLCLSPFFSASADQTGSLFSLDIRIEAQEALNYYGFDAGPADGVFSARTRSAIRAYQALLGVTPTGEISRAGMSLLLTSYREDRRADARRRAEEGLPLPVASEVEQMAQACGVSRAEILRRDGFMQVADINNDGISDYLIDGSAAGCSDLCGAANCMVSVLASHSGGYRVDRFLGGGVTPQTFNCLSSGFCEFARQ